MPQLLCLSIQIVKVGKGHNSLIRFFSPKINQVVYSSSTISSPSFKALAPIVSEVSFSQHFMSNRLTMNKSIKGHNSGTTSPIKWRIQWKENNRGQLFFHKQFQNPSIHGSKDMRGRKSAKILKSEKGHNLDKMYKISQKLIRSCTQWFQIACKILWA